MKRISFAEHGRLHHLQGLRRFQTPSMHGLQRKQEVRPQEPLHNRVRRFKMYELR